MSYEITSVDREARFLAHLTDAVLFFILFLIYVFSMEALFGVMEKGSILRPLGGLLLYLGYYMGFELACSRTPGKFRMGTRVVTGQGHKPTAQRIIIRNFCRLLPFDSISFLLGKQGFHDSLSGTTVVYNGQPDSIDGIGKN